MPQRVHRHLELDVFLREHRQVRAHVLPVPRLVDAQFRWRVAFNAALICASSRLVTTSLIHGGSVFSSFASSDNTGCSVARQLVERVYD